jgi:hypothetical protein
MMSNAGTRRWLIIAGLLVIGCAGSDDADDANVEATAEAPAATPPAAVPAPAAARDVCAMISADELKTATRIDGAGKQSTSGGADVCTWFGSEGNAAVVQVYPSAASYEQSRSAFEGLYDTKAENVSGVGEKAFYIDAATGSMPTGTMSAAKGTSAVSVQIMGGTDAAARKRDATALTNLVLSKL